MILTILHTLLSAAVVELGGLSADVPPGWQDITQKRGLRVAEFCLPTRNEFAEVSAQFLGQARKGIEDRLTATFDPPPGKSIDEVTTTTMLTIPAATIKVIEVRGTFRFFAIIVDAGRKRAGGSKKPASCLSRNLAEGQSSHNPGDKHMKVAAIMDTAKGSYLVTLVGPEEAVARRKNEFLSWLKSFTGNLP